MAVTPLTPRTGGGAGAAAHARPGLVVTDVDPSGAAAAVGVQPGDVIKRVNDRESRR